MTQAEFGTDILNTAVAWAVRLSSGAASDEDRSAFANWRAANPQHQHAWARVELQLQAFEAVRERGGTLARKALCAPSPSRRKLLQGTLGAVIAVGLSGYVLKRSGLLDLLNADLSTDIGHRRQITLADGSALTLDARSAVDVNFTADTRAIRLLRGQMFIRVAHDTVRPLVVSTRDGMLTALGTAFCVRLCDAGSRVAVTDSRVLARPLTGDAMTIATGSVALMQEDGVRVLDALQADAEITWLKGYVTAINRPLGEVVEALRPYLPGFIALSPDAESLRVTGLFLLDDIAATLRQIAQTLPVAVTFHTDYLIRITRR
jgi:transmembrane sensor